MPAVIANSFPAPWPNSAMPGATRPNIIRGITKPKKFPKILFMVTKTLDMLSGKTKDARIPKITAIIIAGSNGNLVNFIWKKLIFLKII